MSSRGKKKTTMAKLSRESRLRERRVEKKAKKDARKQSSVDDPSQPFGMASVVETDEPVDAELRSEN
jgi:hypothetical protein